MARTICEKLIGAFLFSTAGKDLLQSATAKIVSYTNSERREIFGTIDKS